MSGQERGDRVKEATNKRNAEEEHSEDPERDDGKWMRIERNKQGWRRRGGEQTEENSEVLGGAGRDRKHD